MLPTQLNADARKSQALTLSKYYTILLSLPDVHVWYNHFNMLQPFKERENRTKQKSMRMKI